jgi:hypothetical protein
MSVRIDPLPKEIARVRVARLDALARHGARARAELLGRAGARLLDPTDPLRMEAEERLPQRSGLSPAMARAVIEGMARDWTAERLLGVLEAEFPDPDVLDRFVPGPQGRLVRAIAPALSLHIGAGTVPGVTATSIIRALLVGSAAVWKIVPSDYALTRAFLGALLKEAPELAAMSTGVGWEGGAVPDGVGILFDEADLVVVYGGDETVRSVRERLPVTTKLVAYHHRLSAAVLGRDALAGDALAAAADAGAHAVAMFDHRGCVSPHMIFVEEGNGGSARDFAVALAAALERLRHSLPVGTLSPAEGSAVQQLRGGMEMRAAAGEPIEVHAARDGSWTVLLEPPGAIAPCLGRTVRVHPVTDVHEAVKHLTPVGPHLQTVGVAGLDGARLEELANALGEIGAIRICPLGDVAFPPPWWHHDGQGPLRSLVRWVDLES